MKDIQEMTNQERAIEIVQSLNSRKGTELELKQSLRDVQLLMAIKNS